VVAGLVLAVSVLAVVTFVNHANITSANTAAATQRGELHRDEQRLAAALYIVAVSQKASTQTRVSTVSQRCALTDLILGVLTRVHDSADAAGFQSSEAKCLAQLASVKAINAATPTPKPKPTPKPSPRQPAVSH
jgi:hypothetical protein